jgi:mevalonate kinase
VARKKAPSPKSYPGKLLLFGEHIINKGAKGLAIPTMQFTGIFRMMDAAADDTARASHQSLQTLVEYIIHDPTLSVLYDTNKLLTDLERGLYFDSTIPQGYGLGSSGALVAAIYGTYRFTSNKLLALANIKQELAQIESCFHGRSSGLDPLVCYLDRAVILDKGEVAEVFDFKPNTDSHFKVFLIDSGRPRQTAPFVKLFLEKYKDPKFEKVIRESLVKANDVCIDAFLKPSYPAFWKSAKLISQIHYDHFGEFIPESFKSIWKQGLVHNDFYLKICGAGGGGFILGFAQKDTPVQELFSSHRVIELFTF